MFGFKRGDLVEHMYARGEFGIVVGFDPGKAGPNSVADCVIIWWAKSHCTYPHSVDTILTVSAASD